MLHKVGRLEKEVDVSRGRGVQRPVALGEDEGCVLGSALFSRTEKLRRTMPEGRVMGYVWGVKADPPLDWSS